MYSEIPALELCFDESKYEHLHIYFVNDIINNIFVCLYVFKTKRKHFNGFVFILNCEVFLRSMPI